MPTTLKWLVPLVMLVSPLCTYGQTVLDKGQVSFIELSFNNANPSNPFWIVQIFDETNTQLYDPTYSSGLGRFVFDTSGGARFRVAGPQHLYQRPLPTTWDFIGTGPNQPFRATPQNGDAASRLIMGISTFSLPPGLFANDQININMSVAGISNPGAFSLYTNNGAFNDAVGDPNIVNPLFSTDLNLTGITRSTGTGNFFNLGFSAPGIYDVDFQFEAERSIAEGGGIVTSGWYRYRFDVALFAVPEPGTWALLGLSVAVAGIAAWQIRRRKKIAHEQVLS
ncbi:MAG TPA: PEP-CTERM sorting domain-containing protein [Gemmatales bacterium]|nr:PEP-CTERM sorting domain-containing protein [Gemmatales bacterium]